MNWAPRWLKRWLHHRHLAYFATVALDDALAKVDWGTIGRVFTGEK